MSIGHLEVSAEVQFNSWWKLYHFWSTNSLKEQVSFIWIQVIFISMLGLKIHSFRKNWSRRSLLWCHVALRELVRLSDDLVKRWFCQWDIWSIQLNSNWTAGENWWLIFFKRQWTFFLMYNLEGYSFRKNCLWKSPKLLHVVLRQLLRQSFVFASRLLFGSDGIEGPTEIQLKGWWKLYSLCSSSCFVTLLKSHFGMGVLL